jgi:outer membrane murein-binding lipoprotein Lpp
MRKTVGAFDLASNPRGVRVIVAKEPLCSSCRSDGEIDAQIKLLKNDLDAVAKRMKAALQDSNSKSDFPDRQAKI